MQLITESVPAVSARNRLPRGDLDVDRVADRLWIGSAPPPGPDLADAGFDVVVLCAEEYQPRSAWFQGLTSVVHAGFDDGRPSQAELERAVGAATRVVGHLDRARRVLVTCMAGRNRSGLVCALVLHLRYGVSGARAVTELQRRREGALCNPHFVRFLQGLTRFGS